MDLDVLSIIDHIKLNTIERWYGIIRLTLKLISLNLRPRKVNLVHTISNASTARANIK